MCVWKLCSILSVKVVEGLLDDDRIERTCDENDLKYQLVAMVPYSNPPCWRRFELLQESTFRLLNFTIRRSFNWTSHAAIHRFTLRKSDSLLEEPKIIDDYNMLSMVFPLEGLCRYSYVSHQGSNFVLDLHIEKIGIAKPYETFPKLMGGQGANPIEKLPRHPKVISTYEEDP